MQEFVMTGLVVVLIVTGMLGAYWFGVNNGIHKERMRFIEVLSKISVSSFATDIQYGVSVTIAHICNLLREE